MTAKITIDNAGRILIPKKMREELCLDAGDKLEVKTDGDEIKLRPLRGKAVLKKERGVWVYQGEPTDASIVKLIDREREKRIRSFLR